MAIDELLDEHEQGERVRDWLRRNALGLVGGVVLGLALIGGWRYWQSHQQGQRAEASDAYAAMQATLAAGDLSKAAAQAAGLDEGTIAALAALDLAKAQVEAGERDEAIVTLRGASTLDPALRQVVDQRLARLLTDAGKGQEAISLLQGATDPVALEARGDAFAALDDDAGARAAYADALARLDVAAPQRRLLEIKLTDAGGTPPTPEARN